MTEVKEVEFRSGTGRAMRMTTHQQVLTAAELEANPHWRWRCDIHPEDGSASHHGTGATEPQAIINAANSYIAWIQGQVRT